MMWDDPQKRPHRLTVDYVRGTIQNAIDSATVNYDYRKLTEAKEDLAKVGVGWQAYVDAHNNFNVNNNDETMINLIGTWARNTKIIRDMDDKYGSRE